MEDPLRIVSLKRKNIPKVAVLAAGLTAAVVAVTMTTAPAQASPGYASACTGCHTAGGSVAATPSSATLAPGAAYTVALAFTGGTSPVGYWVSGNGASVTASNAGPVSMTAPAAAGSYTYTVWMRSGVVASTTYTITVAAAPVVVTTTMALAMAPTAATAVEPAAKTLTATVTGAGAAGNVGVLQRHLVPGHQRGLLGYRHQGADRYRRWQLLLPRGVYPDRPGALHVEHLGEHSLHGHGRWNSRR